MKHSKVFVHEFKQAHEISGEVFEATASTYDNDHCPVCGDNHVNVLCIDIGDDNWLRMCFDCVNKLNPDNFSTDHPENLSNASFKLK